MISNIRHTSRDCSAHVFTVTLYIYDYDYKRLHLFLTLTKEDGTLASTNEVMMMGINPAHTSF